MTVNDQDNNSADGLLDRRKVIKSLVPCCKSLQLLFSPLAKKSDCETMKSIPFALLIGIPIIVLAQVDDCPNPLYKRWGIVFRSTRDAKSPIRSVRSFA